MTTDEIDDMYADELRCRCRACGGPDPIEWCSCRAALDWQHRPEEQRTTSRREEAEEERNHERNDSPDCP